MRTIGFVLFVLVTAGLAVTSTLVASRYLALEKQLNEANGRLEQILLERKNQEEEKMSLRMESQRIQVDLEARLAEQKNQLDDCTAQRQRDMQEVLGAVGGINKRLTDILVNAAPTAKIEEQPQSDTTANPVDSPKSTKPAKPGDQTKSEGPARAVDVPKGAILTPEQEAKKLQKAE